ncbi:MAG: LPS export ABC transporter periplasmic protein LptC [Lentisphaerales bacterium]|nr:LPS export ABC transporter periplasmic protein LptC [Lentisphaerales bacterium]
MNKILIFLLFIFTISAQDSSFSAKGFKVVEYNKEGKLSSILRGNNGSRFGKEANINGVHFEIFNKDSKMDLTTPKCTYNFETKMCSSKEPVKVVGDGVKITGVGFDIDNQSKKIFIRSKVKVVWKQPAQKDTKSSKDTK